jgi:glycine hydroxymethyltransferase
LRDPSSGADQRVDVALQGPASLTTLCGLLEPSEAAALTALPYTGIMRATLRSHLSAPEHVSFDVFISRTGYTGERVAYEIFVHPSQLVALWNELLDAGRAHGVKPCGLAARDSLRTEAGLPLYGHELAGPLNLAPFHIGFDNFVKLETEFVGKAAYQKNMAACTTRMARYRMNEKGVRVSKPGDPLLDKRGRVVGHVTSCAADSDGFLCGLAMVETALAAEGTALNILALPERVPAPLTAFAPMGSRTTLPDAATVISRFPPRKS